MSNKPISLARVPTTEARTEALRMWALGYDTKDIASQMGHHECWIYNNLPKWRQAAKIEQESVS